jgi:hypothetical protein
VFSLIGFCNTILRAVFKQFIMRKILLSLLVSTYFMSAFAQVTDSVSMTASYKVDVFYNLTTGKADTVSNSNWHIAFSVRNALPPSNVLRSTTIRINEGRGVMLYKSNKTWSNFDTTNWNSWPILHDNDSNWEEGAFNKIRSSSNPFDFGWGTYSMTTHHVTGSNVYLLISPVGLKKVLIQKLEYDTTWHAFIANIDGSDSTYITFNKSQFAGKYFAYYNIASKQLLNREPSTNWHLLFTRYAPRVFLFGIDTFYPSVGVLTNPSLLNARVAGIQKDSTTPLHYNLSTKNFAMNNIGWDWKKQPMGPQPQPWELNDSLSFFIKTGITDVAKIVFTRFDGSSTGKVVFRKTFYTAVGIKTIENNNFFFDIYPNPATNAFNIMMPQVSRSAHILITDITGKALHHQEITNASNASIDLTNFSKGLYFVQVTADGKTSSRKLIVE